jgi:hypothetical protein
MALAVADTGAAEAARLQAQARERQEELADPRNEVEERLRRADELDPDRRVPADGPQAGRADGPDGHAEHRADGHVGRADGHTDTLDGRADGGAHTHDGRGVHVAQEAHPAKRGTPRGATH